MKSLKKDAGMTLLELMFAAGVLALGLSLLFGSLLSFNLVGQLSESRTMAASEVASVMEELRSLPIEKLIFYQPAADLTAPGVDQAMSVSYYDSSNTQISLPLPEGSPVPANIPNPFQIRAELIWTDENGRFYSVHAVAQHER